MMTLTMRHVSVTSVRLLHRSYRTKTAPQMGAMINDDPGLVYIGMPGKAARAFGLTAWGFGKPWSCLDDPRGWQVAYREYLWREIQSSPAFAERVKALHKKTLVCWCKGKHGNDDQPCHGDTLARAIEWLNGCELDGGSS